MSKSAWAEWIEKQVIEQMDARGDIAPPWAQCPYLPRGSLGWRMGHGENVSMVWGAWERTRLPPGRAERLAYLKRHPPAPRSWTDTALTVYAPTWDDDDSLDEADVLELERTLERAGVIADDASYRAWTRNHEPDVTPPWARGMSLDSCLSVFLRDLNFWARWSVAFRRAAPAAHAAYLRRVALDQDSPWQPVLAAAASGRAPSRPPDDKLLQLALLLVARGHAPAPWALGEPASSVTDPRAYSSAWLRWVAMVFDDGGSYDAYLAIQERLHGPPPDSWRDELERAGRWLKRATDDPRRDA